MGNLSKQVTCNWVDDEYQELLHMPFFNIYHQTLSFPVKATHTHVQVVNVESLLFASDCFWLKVVIYYLIVNK